MKLSGSKVKYYNTFIFLLIILSVCINIITIKDGHNWGGDFSQYIISAKNILNGQEFGSGVLSGKNYIGYPPGFSLILAPAIKVFGVNFKVLKLLNVFFWYCSILFLFPLMKRRLNDTNTSLLCCLLLSLSGNFFIFKQNILSDIPFAFFIAVSFYAFEKYTDEEKREKEKSHTGILSVCFLMFSFSYLIKSAGIIFFFSAFYYFLFVRKNIRNLGLLGLFFLATVIAQIFFTGISSGSWPYIMERFLILSLKMPLVLSAFLQNIVFFFLPQFTAMADNANVTSQNLLNISACLVMAAMIVDFFFKSRAKALTLMDIFLFLYFLMLIFWLTTEEKYPRQHGRFIVSVSGIILIAACHVLQSLLLRIKGFCSDGKKSAFVVKALLILVIVMNMQYIVKNFTFNDDDILKTETQQLVRWIDRHLEREDHYFFSHPRVLSMMTGRTGTAIWAMEYARGDSPLQLVKRLKEMNITYVILARPSDRLLMADFERKTYPVQKVFDNDKFEVYRIL